MLVTAETPPPALRADPSPLAAGGAEPEPRAASFRRASMAQRKAARGLAEPVGAAMRTSRPVWMTGQPAAWASVGAPKRRRNQVWMTGWKASRGLVAVSGGTGELKLASTP